MPATRSRASIVGQTFSYITIIADAAPGPRGRYQVLGRCICGNEKVYIAAKIKSSWTKSCGCKSYEMMLLHRDNVRYANRNPEYITWKRMRQRCQNPNDTRYKWYGERGITICERWNSFENFLADMGPRLPKHSIERIDNDKGYYPENCRWATLTEQARNTRHNRLVTFRGKVQPISAWAEELGLNYGTLQARLKHGWSDEEALTAPVRAWGRSLLKSSTS